jgi:hypothetical protein
MKQAALCGSGLIDNIIFNRHSPANRDDCFAPYALMKEVFASKGIEINTVDKTDLKIQFELHQDAQPSNGSAHAYLMLFETPQVFPENGITSNYRRYRKIFTWNDTLVDGDKFVKLNFPNPISVHAADGFLQRDRFCCLISSNRTLATKDERNLYPERVRAIRWFERNAPQDFDLYGVDWDIPAARGGLFGKLERRFWRALSRVVKLQPFPSYCGRIPSKLGVLTRTRFAICYENVRDLPGYITEKIFDCFFSGCIPVYWGASNITDYIPADCFIDRRKFRDTADVYMALKNISELEFRGYQQRIAAFLQSDAAYPFSSEFFAETIVSTIVRDIGNQS